MLILALIAIVIGYIHLKHGSECVRWARWVLIYSYLRFVRKKPPLFQFDINSTDHGKLGISSLPEATLREHPRKLSDHCQALDSIRIWGGNKDGYLLWVQLSRRHNRHSEVGLYFRSGDGEEYRLPSQPDTNVYNTDGLNFSASGLSFEVLEPLRRWRVNFNGYLRRVKDSEIVEANFNFLWIPSSCYVSFPEDFNTSFMAHYFTKQSRICPSHFLDQLATIESHENSGQLHGIVNLGQQNNQVLLRGFKVRSNGRLNWEDVQCKVTIEAFLHDGSAVRLFVEEVGSKRTKFIYGYVLPPCNMSVFHLHHCQTDVEVIVKAAHLQHMDISFTAGGFPYRLQLRMRNECQTFYGDDWEAVSKLSTCDVTLNNHTGDGIVEVVSRNHGHSPLAKRCSFPLLRELNIKTYKGLVVTFSDAACHSSAVVGGKAASLAMMTNIDYDFKEKLFVVPSGVSVTKTAFEIHVRHNPKIEAAILSLTEVAWSGDKELIKSLPQQCNSVVELVSQTPISQQLQEELEQALVNTFKEAINDIKFAVRSSAVGEDGEEMSAAGQNETLLGIKGFQQVCSSISKCWASQFAFRSLEYKRHNGQLLNGGMGVVIQQMVPAQSAGVLFSRNPLTGSPTSMIITSNYGLGESVVSASADPDTITIRRSHDDQLSVQLINTGSKKTIIQMSGESGTVEYETEVEAAARCSVTEEDAIRLANIALFLEKCFGNGRDIEWAIVDGQIYILQSRPVTSESPLTDFDVIHEFDTPSRTDDESYTTANVSEVLPGSQTPLSITSIFRGQMPYFQKRMLWKVDRYKYDPIVIDWMVSYCGHAMFDLIMQKAWCTSDKKDAVLKAFDVGIYGRMVDETEIIRRALERFKVRPPLRKKLVMLLGFTLKGMAIGGWLVRSAARRFQNYRIPIDGTENMMDVHQTIQKYLTDFGDICDPHLSVSFASTMWNVIILNILSDGKDYSTDQYSDFATLIGSCNGAESGNVPASLGELATAISQSRHHANFQTEQPQVALESIHNSNDPKVKKMFTDFLQRHGHRGMKESDLMCKAWGSEQLQLISVLQGMCKAVLHKPRETDSSTDVILQLKSQIKPFKKRILRWVMKYCRQGICYREQAKSLLIKFVDGVRVAYRHLAILMVRQGLLVDPQLIYFFTNEELVQLMLTRSPKLIRRAKCRRRLQEYKDKLRFPEIIRGIPKPISDSDEAVSAIDYSEIIKGFPISQGVITAKARVLTSFHDVDTIQPGEVLITRATDIGWSPYFPMLAGIVTEIGGLISHGAVVAREFGLPCIVGVDNATKLFQSGDWVLLNATQGTIMKVKHQDE